MGYDYESEIRLGLGRKRQKCAQKEEEESIIYDFVKKIPLSSVDLTFWWKCWSHISDKHPLKNI